MNGTESEVSTPHVRRDEQILVNHVDSRFPTSGNGSESGSSEADLVQERSNVDPVDEIPSFRQYSVAPDSDVVRIYTEIEQRRLKTDAVHQSQRIDLSFLQSLPDFVRNSQAGSQSDNSQS